MFQIPTLYTNYQELLLDLDIYGKILSESAINKDELKVLLFEEYKITHPLPTLEDKRYELSDLVSSDYHITYANEVELAENEQLVDLGLESGVDNFELEGNIVVPDKLREHSSYGSVTDAIRSKLIAEFLDNDIEEIDEELSRGTEESFGSVESHAIVYEDDYNEEDSEEDDGSDYDSDDEDDGSDYDSDDDEDDGSDYDSDDEDDGSDYDPNKDTDNEDDYSEDEESKSEDEESYSEDEDGSDYDSDNSDSDYDLNKDTDNEDDYSKDEESKSENEDGSDYDSKEESVYSDDVDLTDSFESASQSVSLVPTPIEVNNRNKASTQNEVIQVETSINREEEPRDLREFVRKHPRCEVSFALRYFSRKEIEKYLMLGKIIKKGTKLHI